MKDILKIKIEGFDATKRGTDIKYALYTKFSEEPVFVGSQEADMYTPIGSVIWGKFLEIINEIVSVYTSNPKLGSNFINNIKCDIVIEGVDVETIQSSYQGYLSLMGEHCLDKLLSQFSFDCKEYSFLPTVNGVSFFSIFAI